MGEFFSAAFAVIFAVGFVAARVIWSPAVVAENRNIAVGGGGSFAATRIFLLSYPYCFCSFTIANVIAVASETSRSLLL